MRPAEMTALQHARLLHEAYLEDRRLGTTGPDPETRRDLTNYLCCHPDARAAAWSEWRYLMLFETVNYQDAAYWLDVEFAESRAAASLA